MATRDPGTPPLSSHISIVRHTAEGERDTIEDIILPGRDSKALPNILHIQNIGSTMGVLPRLLRTVADSARWVSMDTV